MAIIQQPKALSMLGNIKKFIVSSGSSVRFTLKEGQTILVDASYEPGTDGRVAIDIKDVIESRLSYLISHSSFYVQQSIVKQFTAEVDGVQITFNVIRAGVANLADTELNWLKGNFLTWQPTQKHVTYYSPEWLSYHATQESTMKLKAYLPTGTSKIISLGSMSVGNTYTANVQYSHVASLLSNTYPSYYEVWVENSTGQRLTYVQRYLYSQAKSEVEQWFLFENSLGGIDTLRAYGETDFEGEHEHKISTIDGVSSEYKIDTKRNYNQNTGYLNENERRWLLDFFPSKRKYIHSAGAIRQIVVTESDVKYTASELPSDYNFTYRFADDSSALLNLIRNENDIPETITIPDISSPDFHLPPRLSEYPRVPLGEGVIIPAFDPNSKTATVTTLGAILSAAFEEILSKIQSGQGSGELVNLVRENDLQGASDNNVFSALRTLIEISKAITKEGSEQFISKINNDVAKGLIRFLAGIEIGEFIPGMFGGKGAMIDKFGNAEMTSLRLRALLEVPELRYNRLTVIGDELILTENGLIHTVEQLADRSYKLNMKLEDGEAIAFIAGDLVKGIFHHRTGFATSYMRVEEVGQTFMKVTLAADTDVPPQSNMPPMDFMNIARVGNVDDPDRQRYMVFSSKLGGYQLYDGCSDFMNGTLVASFDTAQSFKSIYGNLPLKDGLPYVYAAGLVVQDIVRVDYKGKSVREIYDRGRWQQDIIYYNNDINGTDDVWHLGCRWRCFSSNTTEEPSWTSAAWYMIEGRSDARMEFDSSNGYGFFSGRVDTLITPIVFIGNTNVSADIVEEQWRWERLSGDNAADLVWNLEHTGKRILQLRNEDMGANWSRANPVRFVCTATYPASSINNITDYIEV